MPWPNHALEEWWPATAAHRCRASSVATLEKRFAPAAASLTAAGMLWVAWPKKASKVPTDLTEGRVRAHGLAGGLVDVKVCAVDAVWSGLKFVRRIGDR
jgi:hypothetical protein